MYNEPAQGHVSNQMEECISTALPAKSDSEVTFCLQSYQGLVIDRSLAY